MASVRDWGLALIGAIDGGGCPRRRQQRSDDRGQRPHVQSVGARQASDTYCQLHITGTHRSRRHQVDDEVDAGQPDRTHQCGHTAARRRSHRENCQRARHRQPIG